VPRYRRRRRPPLLLNSFHYSAFYSEAVEVTMIDADSAILAHTFKLMRPAVFTAGLIDYRSRWYSRPSSTSLPPRAVTDHNALPRFPALSSESSTTPPHHRTLIPRAGPAAPRFANVREGNHSAATDASSYPRARAGRPAMLRPAPVLPVGQQKHRASAPHQLHHTAPALRHLATTMPRPAASVFDNRQFRADYRLRSGWECSDSSLPWPRPQDNPVIPPFHH